MRKEQNAYIKEDKKEDNKIGTEHKREEKG